MSLTIKIIRTYTLPTTREGGGRLRVERLAYDPDDWRTPVEWAAQELSDAGCTRHNWGPQFMSEEPKITDVGRGEEMEAVAEVGGATPEQLAEIIRELES